MDYWQTSLRRRSSGEVKPVRLFSLFSRFEMNTQDSAFRCSLKQTGSIDQWLIPFKLYQHSYATRRRRVEFWTILLNAAVYLLRVSLTGPCTRTYMYSTCTVRTNKCCFGANMSHGYMDSLNLVCESRNSCLGWVNLRVWNSPNVSASSHSQTSFSSAAQRRSTPALCRSSTTSPHPSSERSRLAAKIAASNTKVRGFRSPHFPHQRSMAFEN